MLVAAPSALAQSKKDPTVSANYAFTNAVRAGSWTPLIVTVSDPFSRSMDLEINVPTGSPIGASIHVPIATTTTPTRYTIYVPTTSGYNYSYSMTSIQLRDAITGRRIGERFQIGPPTNYWEQGLTVAIVTPNWQANVFATNTQSVTSFMQIGTIPPNVLPTERIGYEGLDVLVLYGVDLNLLDRQVQRAIVNWVDGGGRLVFWPGDHVVPTDTPISKILPAQVGALDSIAISSIDEKWKTRSDNASILARKLTPIGNAESVDFHEGFSPSIQSDFGLGRISVMPIDLFEIKTGDAKNDGNLSLILLKGIVEFNTQPTSQQRIIPVVSEDRFGSNEADARRAVLSELANVADLRTFDVSLLLWMMLGLTILVGPVDWFVLRALHRQPWTWFTTLGWAGVATIGAIMLALTGRGGSSTYRSFTLIDQLDGRTLAQTQMACLYSSNTRKFEITSDAPGWWRIPWDGNHNNLRSGSFIDFEQTGELNLLRPFSVKQWNVLLLENESFAGGGPTIETNLTRVDGKISGTIQNTTAWPIKSLTVISKSNALRIQRTIAPGEIIDLSAAESISLTDPWIDWPELPLNARRNTNMRNAIENDSNAALLLVRFESFDGPKLSDNTGINEQHTAILRSLIYLNEGGDE